jgi:YhcH/YjgK/YiaL family protein
MIGGKMVFDLLDNFALYQGLAPGLPAAFRFALENDLSLLRPGRLEVDGDRFYVTVQDFISKPADQGRWEAHRNYIDVHCVVEGRERIGFASAGSLELDEYVPEKDFQALHGAGNYLDLFPGLFAMFLPGDAHMPGLAISSPERVRKVVLKVELQP